MLVDMHQVTMQEMLKEYLIKGNVEKIQQPATYYWANFGIFGWEGH